MAGDGFLCVAGAEVAEGPVLRAFPDPTLLRDERVLHGLLTLEDKYLPASDYFRCVQTDIQPYMRKMAADWMLDVCMEDKSEEEVFPLAMNYMDRVLSVLRLQKHQLQLLGAVCMFIASKLKDTLPITADKLIMYTANSISLECIMELELIVLRVLKWDISAITPHDFLEQILTRLPLDESSSQKILRHAQTFIALCATDFKFAMYPPSMVAAGSIASAARGIMSPQWCSQLQLIERLSQIISTEEQVIDCDCLRGVQDQIEQALHSSFPQQPASPSASYINSMVTPQKCVAGQPTTPTDVRDPQFS